MIIANYVSDSWFSIFKTSLAKFTAGTALIGIGYYFYQKTMARKVVKQDDDIVICSYNIAGEREVKSQVSRITPELSFKNRWVSNECLLTNLIQRYPNVIFLLQEVGVSSVGYLNNFFQGQNFTVYQTPYNASSNCFSFMIAANTTYYEFQKLPQFYYTDNGCPLDNNNRQGRYERSAQMMKVKIRQSDNNEFILVNTHPDVEQEKRIQEMTKLVNKLHNQELKKIPTIVGGDFNLFNSNNNELCTEQISILTDAEFTWATGDLEKKGARSTFFPFLSDIKHKLDNSKRQQYDDHLKSQNNKAVKEFLLSCWHQGKNIWVSPCLDGIFIRNLCTEYRMVNKCYTYLQGKVIETSSDDFDLGHFAKTVLNEGYINKNSSSIPPSDHFAVLMKLTRS